MAPPPSSDNAGGFTLLEVLVAMVVLAFLMVGLAEGVRTGLALRHAQTRRLGATAELDASMRLLRNVLTRLPVIPGSNRLIESETGVGIKGEPDRLSFVGDLPSGVGTTRLADITLYVDKKELILAWRPHHHERPLATLPALTRTVLLYGVERLELAYWGAPAGQLPAWQARWKAQAAPDLIRVRLVFAKHDPRRWPELITSSRL
jgi:general secretion pathway protein J